VRLEPAHLKVAAAELQNGHVAGAVAADPAPLAARDGCAQLLLAPLPARFARRRPTIAGAGGVEQVACKVTLRRHAFISRSRSRWCGCRRVRWWSRSRSRGTTVFRQASVAVASVGDVGIAARSALRWEYSLAVRLAALAGARVWGVGVRAICSGVVGVDGQVHWWGRSCGVEHTEMKQKQNI
jgi:hypothetical protein